MNHILPDMIADKICYGGEQKSVAIKSMTESQMINAAILKPTKKSKHCIIKIQPTLRKKCFLMKFSI